MSRGRENIGFIGLGNMGGRMAARLLSAGLPLVVYDVRTDAAFALAALGARRAGSPREVAQQCDIICTSLPGPQQAAAVFLDGDGVVAGVAPGAVCIDFTTNAPAVVASIAAKLRSAGAELLDAPVSGGVEGARNGSLTVLVGGSEAALQRCRGVLEAVAAAVIHVGKTGDASICKLLHNCAVFCANLATMECLTVGVKAGVAADVLIDVFQKSGLGRNLDLQVAMPATLFQGNFEPRYSMELAYKDMSLAVELARQCEAPMEMAERCQREMAEAVARGWAGRDNTIFLTLREERTGVQVRQTPKTPEPAL